MGAGSRQEENLSRRAFIRRCAQRLISAIGAGLLAYPILSFVTFRKSRKKTVVFPAKDQSDAVSFKEGVFLIRRKGDTYAFTNKCTHLGCRFNFDPLSRTFRCPCHGSVFDLRGKRLKGPAKRDLEKLPLAEKRNGDIQVAVTL